MGWTGDLGTFPSVGAYAVATPEDSVTLDGDIVLVALKKFARFKCIIDTGAIISEPQGDVGSMGFKNSVTGKIASSDPKVLAWAQRMLNGCCVVIVKEKNGQMRVIGSKEQPAQSETMTHTNNATANNLEFSIYDTIGKIAPLYTGVIDLDETS